MSVIAAMAVCLAVLGALVGCSSTGGAQGTALQRAAVAAGDVQRNYDAQTGFFCPVSSNCWWWSANDLTALADFGQAAHTKAYLSDFLTTYNRAAWEGPDKAKVGAFLDTWNDDDGWWGLAWLAAYHYVKPYDPTQSARYLQLSEKIFTYVADQWNASNCGGGLWQNQKPTHLKDAIANELFLSMGAELYQATGNQTYLTWANREWTWFDAAGFIGSKHLVHDHMSSGCTPQSGQYWTYNQGALLGGLAALYQDTKAGNPWAANTMLHTAETVADCVTSLACGGNPQVASPTLMTTKGVLTEACETMPCTYAPAYAFKGVFVRNLGELNAVTGRYTRYLATNAGSLWTEGRNGSNLFGFYWASPPAFYLPAGGEAAVEGAALDLLTTQIPD